MQNGATLLLDKVTMTEGKARNNGGAIYLSGSGSPTMAFTNCLATIQTFDATRDGGLIFVFNPNTVISTSNCCYANLYAGRYGAHIQGTYTPGTYSIPVGCPPSNVTDNSPTVTVVVPSPSTCEKDEYFSTGTSTCISIFFIFIL